MGRRVNQIFTNISFKLFCCYYSHTEEKETVKSLWSGREGSEATQFESRAHVFKHYAIACLSCQAALLSNVLNPQVTFLIFQVLSSVTQSCSTLCDTRDCSRPGLYPSPIPGVYSNSCPLSRWCHPPTSSSVVPFSPCPQSFPASGSFQMSKLFAPGSQSIGFSFSNSPSNEYSGLISRINWLDLLVVQGTLKSLLQHDSSKASILWHSAFFMVQFSYPYMTTGKTIDLTRQISVEKVMSLLFNVLSKFVIAFLPRSKCLLISWLQSPPTVILSPRK